jgi:hypothetical protein
LEFDSDLGLQAMAGEVNLIPIYLARAFKAPSANRRTAVCRQKD